MLETLSVFPLHTVLFPEARLSLRIFEQRYLRMVSECMKQDKSFVVSLIQGEGRETGDRARCFSIATKAKIIDFNQGKEAGILDIVVQGSERVILSGNRYEADNLMCAEAEAFSEEMIHEVMDEFTGLQKLFESALVENQELKNEFFLSQQAISATQLSFYLSHLAPVSVRKKQKLLELTHTHARLEALRKIFSEQSYTLIA